MGGSWHGPGQLMDLSRIRVSGGLSLSGYARLVGGPPPSAGELAMVGGAAAPLSPGPSPAPPPAGTPAPTPAPSGSRLFL